MIKHKKTYLHRIPKPRHFLHLTTYRKKNLLFIIVLPHSF